MKLLKPRTFIIFALVGLAGAVLLHTSQNVQHAQERLEALEQSVQREEEKIRMLKAEWETLNRPERLERLANEFLDLVPPSPDQMTSEEVHLPESVPSEFVLPEVESFPPRSCSLSHFKVLARKRKAHRSPCKSHSARIHQCGTISP